LPLGSQKPWECVPEKFQCPSHMICVMKRQRFHCVCDRYFGFYGPKCQQTSKATWLLTVISSMCTTWSIGAILSNIGLALHLKERKKIKMDRTGQTLFFNLIGAVSMAAMNGGVVVTAVGLDPNMIYYHLGRPIVLPTLFSSLIFSALSVSVVWIIDVFNATPTNSGSNSVRCKHAQEQKILTVLYCSSIASFVAIVVVISVFVEHWVPLVSIVGVAFSTFIGVAYHFAGRRVVNELRSLEVSVHVIHWRTPPSLQHAILKHRQIFLRDKRTSGNFRSRSNQRVKQ
jgi:hypothetical protein